MHILSLSITNIFGMRSPVGNKLIVQCHVVASAMYISLVLLIAIILYCMCMRVTPLYPPPNKSEIVTVYCV